MKSLESMYFLQSDLSIIFAAGTGHDRRPSCAAPIAHHEHRELFIKTGMHQIKHLFLCFLLSHDGGETLIRFD